MQGTKSNNLKEKEKENRGGGRQSKYIWSNIYEGYNHNIKYNVYEE